MLKSLRLWFVLVLVAISLGLLVSPGFQLSASTYVPAFENRTGTDANSTHYAVAFGAGVWVRAGGGVPSWSADGGENWTNGTSNVASGSFRNVEFVNGRFFALCASSCATGKQIQYSDDGKSWTGASSPTTGIPVNDANWNDVAFGNGVLVAVSSGMNAGNETANRILRSTDNGLTWTTEQLPCRNCSAPLAYETAEAVVFAEGLFVAVGSKIMTSEDGDTWTVRATITLKDIAYGNGVFVAVTPVGNGTNHVWRSDNGTSWSAVSHASIGTSPTYVHRIRFGNGVFLFGSSTRFLTTATGHAFSTATNWLTLGSGQWRGLGFGEGRFVAVGDTSNGGASRTIGSTDTPDTTAPSLVQQVPSDGAIDVDDTSNISLRFSESVVPGAGQQLVIKKVSDNSIVSSIDASSSQVTISGAVVTINPTTAPFELPAATEMYVLIDRGAFTDIAGNGFAGISSSSGYRFTTAVDVTPPAPPTAPDLYVTADTGFSNSDNIITSTVNPNFRFQGAERGGIITVTASRIGVSDRTCTRPGDYLPDGCIMSALSEGTWTVVTSHTDVNGNTSANSAALTVVVDGTAPSLTSISPARDAASVAVDANIQLTYNEDVYAATGNVIVKSGGSTCPTTDQTVSVLSGAVTVSGGTVTVNPPNNFAHSSVQCLSFAAGVIKDIAGNNAPLHDPTASGGVRFTTSAPDVTSPSATISSPSSPASSRTLVYEVVFDETVNGVAPSDFQNLGTATCTFSVNQSSGTTVSLTATCTSDGTVIVRLGANTVSDTASNTGPTSAVTASTVTINSPVNPTTTVTTAPSATGATTPASVTSTTVATGQRSITTVTTVAGNKNTSTINGVGAADVTTTTTAPTVTTTTIAKLSTVKVPRTEVGGSSLLIDGKVIEGVITREDNRLTVTAGPLVVRIWAIAADGGKLPLDADGRLRVQAGDSVTVDATGFSANTRVEVRLYSDPVLLGLTDVDTNGVMDASYEIPEGIPSGNHNVVLIGERNGDSVTMALSVTLGEESNSNALTMALLGILIIAGVTALTLPAFLRRRRTDEEEGK
jgi:hypothetical protein